MTDADLRGMLARAPEAFELLAPEILDAAATVDSFVAPHVYVGCGSSLDVAESIAGPERAISASDAMFGRPEGALIAVSRSGSTSELVSTAATGRFSLAITCVPDSPVGELSDAVLDLSAAIEPTHMAVTSTLVTVAAIAVIESSPEERPRLVSELTAALTGENLPELQSGRVQWLTPWRGLPVARELARKSTETGRSARWGHPFEFLHGDDLDPFADGAMWVVIDSRRRLDEFCRRIGGRTQSVELLPYSWETADVVDLVGLFRAGIERLLPGSRPPRS